ncbi:hypothetical protein JCM3775_002953 [Rhodotorula graminis]
MGPPPLHLDYTANTYLVLSSSSSSSPPPPLPASDAATLSSRLSYAGPLGPGNLDMEHVFVLGGVPSGSSGAAPSDDQRQLVEHAAEVLRRTGEGKVEVMAPHMRSKR